MNGRSYDVASASPGAGRAQGGAREALLEAALEAFGERGFHGTSMRQIAAAAEVGLGNIYNYFGSKSEILLEVLRRASAAQMAAVDEALEALGGADVRTRFLAAVAAFVGFEFEHLTECFVANSELRYLDSTQRAQIVEQRDAQQAVFEDLVEEGVELGVFRTSRPKQACLAFLTMCAGVTIWYRPDGPRTPEELSDSWARYALATVEGDD
jgi:AcrR family transcriptional regulator